MNNTAQDTNLALPTQKRPLTFLFAKWHGYVLAAMFILYGGVKIIFGVLDHDTGNFIGLYIFLGIGAFLIVLAYAYRDQKIWGWYGLIIVYALASVQLLFSLKDIESVVLFCLFLIGLVALLWPTTKQEVFRH